MSFEPYIILKYCSQLAHYNTLLILQQIKNDFLSNCYCLFSAGFLAKLNYVPAQLYRSPVDDLTERDDAKPKEKAKEPAKGRDKVNRAHRDAAFHFWIKRKTS